MGRHTLNGPTLVYMPHCPRPLYESILSTNFTPESLPHLILLGNDLADYLPDFSRGVLAPAEDDFVKPKKKRKDRGPQFQPKDSVLRRIGEF